MKTINIPGICNHLTAMMFIAIGVATLLQPLAGSATRFLLIQAVLWTAIVSIYLSRFIKAEWRPERTKPFSIYLLLFLLMIMPSTLTGINPLKSTFYAILLIVFYFAFLAVREAFTSSPRGFLSPRMFVILSAWGAVALVLCRFAFRFISSSGSLLPWFSLAQEMPEQGKNLDHLADFLLVALFPVIATVGSTASSAGRRMIWRAAAAVTAAGIILSFCRSAWIAIAVEIAVLAVLDRSQRRILLAGLAACCVLVFFLPGITDRLSSIFSTAQSTNVQRLDQWAASFELIRHSPFAGYGIGSFGQLYRQLTGTTVMLPCPHNLFLHLAVECGIPALFIFLGVTVHFLRRMGRTGEDSMPDDNGFARAFRLGVFACFIGMLCFGMFDL